LLLPLLKNEGRATGNKIGDFREKVPSVNKGVAQQSSNTTQEQQFSATPKSY